MKLEHERASATCALTSSACASVDAAASVRDDVAAFVDAAATASSASAQSAADTQQQSESTTATRNDDTSRSPSSELAAAIATPLPPSTPPQHQTNDLALHDRSRLFIVCGRGRKPDELRALFSTCGEIKNLHFALDRSSKSRVRPSH